MLSSHPHVLAPLLSATAASMYTVYCTLYTVTSSYQCKTREFLFGPKCNCCCCCCYTYLYCILVWAKLFFASICRCSCCTVTTVGTVTYYCSFCSSIVLALLSSSHLHSWLQILYSCGVSYRFTSEPEVHFLAESVLVFVSVSFILDRQCFVVVSHVYCVRLNEKKGILVTRFSKKSLCISQV